MSRIVIVILIHHRHRPIARSFIQVVVYWSTCGVLLLIFDMRHCFLTNVDTVGQLQHLYWRCFVSHFNCENM
jgi:hypothetical protein